MEVTADLIYGFAGSLLSERYDSPRPTPEFHKKVWEYCCSPHPYVAISAPRAHAKSTAVTHAYVLACILFRVADYVVIISDTETQAIQFLNNIKMELLENQTLINLFQFRGLEKDAEREIIGTIGPDHKKFRILVRGASGGGGAIRGLLWRNKRPNLIICDDIENDEAVVNEERRAKFREWFFGALLPVLSDYGKIRVVGTILHFDSLLERLMPQTTGDGAVHTVHDGLTQYSVAPNVAWHAIKFRAHTDFDDFSTILWPEKFNEDRLRGIRANYIGQGYPEGYAQEYLNYPISETDSFFRRSDFLPMEDGDRKARKTYYASLDLAISTEDKRSYTSGTVGGVDELGCLHIVDQHRKRLDGKEIIELLFDIQKDWAPEQIAIEKGVLEKALGPFIRDEMLRRNVFINFYTYTRFADKRTMARSIQGRMRQGGVKFNKEAAWYPTLEEEMLRFDRGSYDDQVDTMAGLGLMLDKMQPAQTDAEIADDAWEQELYSTTTGISITGSGQSSVTGY